MNKPFEERLPFFSLGLVVLAIFYGIYFTKMLIQKIAEYKHDR